MAELVLTYRLDYCALALACAAGVAWIDFRLRRRCGGRGLARRCTWSLVALLLLTGLAVEREHLLPRQLRDEPSLQAPRDPARELAQRGLAFAIGLAFATVLAFNGIADARRQAAVARREAENAGMARSLGELSHEIRSPMTSIVSYCKLLERPTSEGLEFDRSDALSTIRRQGEYLLQLADRMLDWSQAESGTLRICRARTRLPTLLGDVRDCVRPQADAARLSFAVEFARPVPEYIETDPLRLRQILVNLLTNAVKYTERGGVRLIVDCDDRAADESGRELRLRFDVVDTGLGLDAAQAAALFQPFGLGRRATSSSTRGAGLGLPLSRRLAELLGGTLTVQSEAGVGSTFTATISAGRCEGARRIDALDAPNAEPQPAAEAELSDDTQPPGDRATATLRGRVLVADDSLDFRRLMALVLTNAGLEVSQADDGRAALDLAAAARREGRPFDLIVADVEMPHLDGRMLAAALQARGEQTPVVACSAHAEATEEADCLQSGCTAYLRKPIEPHSLLRKVSEILSRRDNAMYSSRSAAMNARE